MTTDYTDPSSELSEERLNQWEAIATRIAKAVVAELPPRTGGEVPPLPTELRFAHSLFSELRFALGISDTINGTPTQLLPISVTNVDSEGKGKIKYQRDKLVGLGAKKLAIAYRAGEPQIVDIPATGGEITIDLNRANAVAVTLFDDVGSNAKPILVSFVTYQ